MATSSPIHSPSSFTLMVSKAPYDSRNAESAIKFCYAALSKGHTIDQVFFYRSGVYCASTLLSPPSDELNIYNEWLKLYEQYDLKLNVCNTAASRRGIVNQDTTVNGAVNVEKPFVMTGLSDYFSALATGSKNIQF